MAEKEENLMDDNADVAATEETVEKVIPEIDSKYRMIILAAQRAKQLQRGANARVDLDPRKHKNTRIALKELDQKKVHFDILEQ
jgi:DNA-directed RNA polymerase subunit omega